MTDHKAIWKYSFQIKDVVPLEMPAGARILPTVAPGEYGHLTIWAEVHPNAPAEVQVLRVFGTGHPLPAIPMEYIGTDHSSHLVWHVYHDYNKRSLG